MASPATLSSCATMPTPSRRRRDGRRGNELDAYLGDIATLASGGSCQTPGAAIGDANANMCWRLRAAAIPGAVAPGAFAGDPAAAAAAAAADPGSNRHRQRCAKYFALARRSSAKVTLPAVSDSPGGTWAAACLQKPFTRLPPPGDAARPTCLDHAIVSLTPTPTGRVSLSVCWRLA